MCVINREAHSLFIFFRSLETLTLTHWGARVREEKLSQCERERLLLSGDHLLFWGSSILVLILSLRKLWGFLLYGFPEENSLCLLSLVMCLCFIDALVILSMKRS